MNGISNPVPSSDNLDMFPKHFEIAYRDDEVVLDHIGHAVKRGQRSISKSAQIRSEQGAGLRSNE